MTRKATSSACTRVVKLWIGKLERSPFPVAATLIQGRMNALSGAVSHYGGVVRPNMVNTDRLIEIQENAATRSTGAERGQASAVMDPVNNGEMLHLHHFSKFD
jgi:hypothetical protein